ncbi:glycerol-3-phosphate dehydrogenase (NAD(P)+) [Clostridium punense]|uniref:Glycerol-3-phosphate dehydrogenase n=1 Tax=Clostridium punense TaxID=1054297 RepID=A0ABS4KC39_9CLOT|nr:MULTISPECIES: NAD(P)H-dependent glycerol-3-phosphate dehydrogenase [Clostridium]EQB87680.1 glycerol-3-phosphate dehydrogenase [Clostridium sp. BL8]MBP2024184.1 glycerol-3-phosphate dehydrogenase (NAD(P)+) [Clostridium punense]
MNISVLGCGRWGTFLAWYANKVGHNVCIWGREGSGNLLQLKENRKNEYLSISEEIKLTNSLEDAVSFADIIIISISAQQLRNLAKQLLLISKVQEKIFVLCMKGLEATSGKRLSQVFKEELGSSTNVAVWLGPGHVQDFVRDIPNCMVIGSENIEVTKTVVNAFNSDLIRFYYGQDLVGNEIGAATKNVMGIAAGMLDGVNYTSLKGALMARGTREISRLVRAMGGNDITIYGLSHLGDYEATLFSPFSNNRRFGEDFVGERKFTKLAEGVATLEALRNLSKQYDVELPICNALYEVIFNEKCSEQTLLDLFLRPVKFEF